MLCTVNVDDLLFLLTLIHTPSCACNGEGTRTDLFLETSVYCKTGYFHEHVIFAVFAVDSQSAKINDRDFKKTEK